MKRSSKNSGIDRTYVIAELHRRRDLFLYFFGKKIKKSVLALACIT